MNEILQKRIEEAARDYSDHNYIDEGVEVPAFIEGADFALKNQWISVEEALPKENRIIARLSESFCGTKDCIKVLHFCERYGLTSPEGYYDLCGENVPTNAITHWMMIPTINKEEK